MSIIEIRLTLPRRTAAVPRAPACFALRRLIADPRSGRPSAAPEARPRATASITSIDLLVARVRPGDDPHLAVPGCDAAICSSASAALRARLAAAASPTDACASDRSRSRRSRRPSGAMNSASSSGASSVAPADAPRRSGQAVLITAIRHERRRQQQQRDDRDEHVQHRHQLELALHVLAEWTASFARRDMATRLRPAARRATLNDRRRGVVQRHAPAGAPAAADFARDSAWPSRMVTSST